ncbi:MAG: integrase/recombinase XerD, partial [Miltoncostaeaceae bacterium]|nr:integrase/recombinase XerD [Miltoncostaeaceae bacterium]
MSGSAPSPPAVDPEGFRRLVGGFLATRASANTRAAYARDLVLLGGALGIPPADGAGPAFGVEEDPAARAAAEQLAAIPLAWWLAWRDALPGRVSSRRRRVAAARAFCRWWSRLFALETPLRELRPPGAAAAGGDASGGEMVALSQAEVRRLCEAAEAMPGPLGARTRALVEVLYGCGLRASEIAALDLSACHLDDREDPHVVVTGKGARTRAVAVPSVAREALLAYLAVGRPELRARVRETRGRSRDADAVFLSTRGRRITRGDVWRLVARAAERAGVRTDDRRAFPHALRHSCGTHLIQAGVDIRYVQAHLGHASP